MSNLPAYIFKDVTLFADAESKIGQVAEIVLVVLEAKTEEMRNGGMIKPREIHMGYNATTMSFKLAGVDPQALSLFGLAPGLEKPIIGYGYLQDETGVEHAAMAEMRGWIKKSDLGTWKPGEAAPLDSEFVVNSYRLSVDGAVLIEIDDFDMKAGGVSATPRRQEILRFA